MEASEMLAGVIVVDDIDVNYGFKAFSALHPECLSFCLEVRKPIRPKGANGGSDQKGLFGINN